MLTVSDAFKAAILPGTSNFRRTAVRVTLNVSEATITYDTYTAVNSEAGFSDVTKVTDEKIDNVYRVATCEPDYWKLDGTTVFSPAVTIDVGYASSALSLADGTFTSDPGITITTTGAFTSKGMTLFFDRMSGDYPEEFDIDITYSVGPVTIYHLAVTGNDSPYFLLDADINPSMDPVDTITITFKKMNLGYRRARLTELFMGFRQQYGIGGSDDMLSIATTDQIDITGMSLPHGDAIMKLSNINGDFNPLNPTGIAKNLQAGAEMIVEHGVYIDNLIEYVKTKTCRFADWKDAGQKTVELNGLDTIGYYGDLQGYVEVEGWAASANPHYEINTILGGVGIPTDLYDITGFPNAATSGFMRCPAADTVREDLRLFSQWLCKVCVTDKDGVIKFIDIDSATVSELNLDDCYDDPTIEKNEIIGGVDVNVYTATLGDTAETVAIYKDTWSGLREVKIPVSFEWGDLTSVVSGASIYVDMGFYGPYYTVMIDGEGAEVTVTISGKPYTVSTALYQLDNSNPDGRATRVLIDNPHICTEAKAAEVAAWTLANYNRLLKLTYNYRGNPALEMGDAITGETVHGDKGIIVTRQDLTFDGTLSGNLEGVG